MASLIRNIAAGILGSPTLLHPRETQWVQGTLGALNAEVITDCDGCASVALDLRGTLNMSVEVAGTVDGVNYIPIPLRPLSVAAKLYVAAATGTTPGAWVGTCAGFRKVRARVTAYTSGAATATLAAGLAPLDQSLDGMISTPITILGTAGAAATLTIPSPGAGLRNYVTYVAFGRFANALLTAGAAPVTITTTNLPNAMAFSVPADAAAQGTLTALREDFAYPLMSTAQGTTTTFVAPLTTGVQWRLSAAYYVAP